MTLSNHKSFTKARTLLLLLISAILVDLSISLIPGSISNLFSGHWLALGASASIVILLLCNISLFKIEGEYEILHLKSKSLFSTLIPRSKGRRYEFPKAILAKAVLDKGLLYHKLTICVNTNHGIKKVDSFNLSFISSKKAIQLTRELQNEPTNDYKVTEPELSAAI